MNEYRVYARVNAAGCIVEINSSAFLSDLTGWVEIDHGTGDRYHHAQGNYLDGPLMDDRWVYRYKLVDGKVFPRTQAEMDADRAAQPGRGPSEMESLMELVLDQEERLCMLELGQTE